MSEQQEVLSAEARVNGIAFQLRKNYEYRGHKIPQQDLYHIAKRTNISDLVKKGLAYQWLVENGLLQTKALTTKQHTTPQHAASQHIAT